MGLIEMEFTEENSGELQRCSLCSIQKIYIEKKAFYFISCVKAFLLN